jgi:hypothetical protein
MTEQEEADYILEIAKLSGIDVDNVQSVVNAQLALFMAELATKEFSNTIFGKIFLEKGTCHIQNPNDQIKRLTSEFGVITKLIFEMPSDIKNV